MDNKDKQNIEEHFLKVDTNNYNLIQNMNQQVKINDSFNKTFIQLKEIIKIDRLKIQDKLNKIELWNKDSLSQGLFLEQIFRLNVLKEQVEQIQENIASARLELLHPNILTKDEIELYDIDFKKLQNIKLGVEKFENKLIIFAIKIPTQTIKLNSYLILPVPNNKNKELNFDKEIIIRYSNKTFTFEENKSVQELKLSKNCIFNQNIVIMSLKLIKK